MSRAPGSAQRSSMFSPIRKGRCACAFHHRHRPGPNQDRHCEPRLQHAAVRPARTEPSARIAPLSRNAGPVTPKKHLIAAESDALLVLNSEKKATTPTLKRFFEVSRQPIFPRDLPPHEAEKSRNACRYRVDRTSFPWQLRSLPLLHLECEFCTQNNENHKISTV
jgi:hypothetical protein